MYEACGLTQMAALVKICFGSGFKQAQLSHEALLLAKMKNEHNGHAEVAFCLTPQCRLAQHRMLLWHQCSWMCVAFDLTS